MIDCTTHMCDVSISLYIIIRTSRFPSRFWQFPSVFSTFIYTFFLPSVVCSFRCGKIIWTGELTCDHPVPFPCHNVTLPNYIGDSEITVTSSVRGHIIVINNLYIYIYCHREDDGWGNKSARWMKKKKIIIKIKNIRRKLLLLTPLICSLLAN